MSRRRHLAAVPDPEPLSAALPASEAAPVLSSAPDAESAGEPRTAPRAVTSTEVHHWIVGREHRPIVPGNAYPYSIDLIRAYASEVFGQDCPVDNDDETLASVTAALKGWHRVSRDDPARFGDVASFDRAGTLSFEGSGIVLKDMGDELVIFRPGLWTDSRRGYPGRYIVSKTGVMMYGRPPLTDLDRLEAR